MSSTPNELENLQEFQANNLGYNFKNIEFLTDALTHSTDDETHETFRRLRVLGNAVLKLVSSKYILQSSGLVDPGVLSKNRKLLINVSTKQTPVAKKLFGRVDEYNCSSSVLKISLDVLENSTLPYHKFLQTIFAAVFLDAGGSKGAGIKECFKLFLKLWEDFDVKINHPELSSCFPVEKEIKDYWIRMGMDESFISFAENKFDVKFTNSDLLCEALIHKTFYDVIINDGEYSSIHMPNYERLEFLGGTVLGLIITEFMFHEYPDSEASFIHELANSQLKECLVAVAERLEMSKCGVVRTYRNVVLGNYDDILEAVIGAIYVDGGEDVAREFILREFQLKEPEVLTLENSVKRRGRLEKVKLESRSISSVGSVTKHSMKEEMDYLYENGERYYINQRIQRYGMLHEICYNNILPLFWKMGRACKGFVEFVKFVVKILIVLGIVFAILIS